MMQTINHDTGQTEINIEKRVLVVSLVIPAIFTFLMCFIWFAGWLLDSGFYTAGIYPRTLKGLPGIISAPFIHAGINHLVDNALTFFLLAMALFYFYRGIGWKVFLVIYLTTGLWIWAGARSAWHIGASGLIYGLGSFLFFSGLFRGYPRLTGLSLLIAFLYGSMVWGIFPIQHHISWESHLLGAAAGFLSAVWFRNQGPQRKPFDWENEEDDNESNEITDNANSSADKPGFSVETTIKASFHPIA